MPVIRPAVHGDARAIAEAHVLGWRAAYRDIVPAPVLAALSVDERTAQWTTRLGEAERYARRIWVCQHDEGVHGFAATGPTRDIEADAARTSELLAIYLAPEAWGLGCGRALMTHSLEDVRARGWSEMSLWVFEANVRARRFYERAGFAVDGVRKAVALGGATSYAVRYRRVLRMDGPSGA